MAAQRLKSMAAFLTGLLLAWLCAVLAPGMAQAEKSPAGSERPPAPTLCILDFNRLGADSSMDWLQRGLADMMIGTMNRLGPYQVIERAHLREILREHGLGTTGLVDLGTALRHARLAKAQLLLLGSFARQQDRLTVQVRLIRIADQQMLAQASWTDRPPNALTAPQALSEQLLASLGSPVDPTQFAGIEQEIPRAIDVAQAYYTGMGAFDHGQYPEALAHYLDAARQAGAFTKAYAAVLEMYYLLGQSEHAVLFAQRLARSYEEDGDLPNALQYYFAAAQHSLAPLHRPSLAIRFLEKLLRLVRAHERQTGEIAATKQFIVDKIAALYGTGKYQSFGSILAHRSIRYRLWPGDIEAELRRRATEQARGGYAVWHDGKWVKRPVPKPSVLMWKVRAQRTLARAYARLGSIKPALDQYQELLAEYEFLARYPFARRRFRDPIRTEAHFMALYHYAKTGRLVRDHALNHINRLNIVQHGFVFRRNFRHREPDTRARVASRYADRGYEYFDFAASSGHQIDAVTLRARIAGIGAFGISLPHAAGWPPQFSLSRRFKHFKFSTRGTYERTVTLPAGTEFLSIGTSWGRGLFSNTPAEVQHHRQFGPQDGPDIVWWQASFAVSPTASVTARRGTGTRALLGAPMRKLIDRYAAGWERALVIRQPQTTVYTGNPVLDVYAEDWLVYAMDGDIHIFYGRDPQLTIKLPITINTREREIDPSLVRTHDGRYALLWGRGTSRTNARRFVAFSADLRRWETPQRLMFAASTRNIGYTYARAEPLERTFNVVRTRRGYAMLLAQGLVRYSKDLRHWGPARKVIPQDLYRNCLVQTGDETLWAVYENSSDELQPYTPNDWLHGYFVVNGKPYRHVTELHVDRSTDGVRWHPAGTITFPGQPSGLWAFPVSEHRIGIAVGFNNLFVKWLTASRFRDLRLIDSALQVMHQSAEVGCFVRDASLVCIRPLFDVEGQQSMLLATSSRTLYEKFTE